MLVRDRLSVDKSNASLPALHISPDVAAVSDINV